VLGEARRQADDTINQDFGYTAISYVLLKGWPVKNVVKCYVNISKVEVDKFVDQTWIKDNIGGDW
jgi:hypothetical protein